MQMKLQSCAFLHFGEKCLWQLHIMPMIYGIIYTKMNIYIKNNISGLEAELLNERHLLGLICISYLMKSRNFKVNLLINFTGSGSPNFF